MAHVLRQLPRSAHPDLLVGHEHFDDAGVFRIREDYALVQTLDFFPPLVDDPFTFGRIAAANALSDVYAMGGLPLTAMNIVCFPDKELPLEMLMEILRGGGERCAEAGAVIVGGHSVRDAEVKFGISVTGWVDPRCIFTNAGARPGDVLILTKPIGSGTLTTARKDDRIADEDLVEAVSVMIELNAGARDAMVEIGAHAATDITGFGLVGHAFEIAEAGNVTIEIDAGSVPLLQRAAELAEAGVLTRAHKGTIAHLADRLRIEDVAPWLAKLLCDAQTSGGLLIAVPEEKADALVEALQRRRTPVAMPIGRVLSRSDAAVVLRA
ncbi:MAG: selenide, water dikinase SelD [Phycisphaerae bacterium]|nr:selenide, water dikinase SelD [Phycisphaerae bacterium]